MTDPDPIDPRRRIRELLAIPDRDRTDEQWDELNELEIRTAPGNRESDRSQDKPRPSHGAQPRRQERGGKGNAGNAGNNGNAGNSGQRSEARGPDGGRPPAKRQHRRPKRPTESSGNS